ncbi:MAG: HAMP domain-containing histidine kinase, partial [Coriobacteriales bacterium]|nr:HAMP domain-containing histidine kinase [Coriobacteriales bacterium]
FADASQLYDTTLSQGLIALLIWVLAMVAFYVMGRVLSRMVLRPVEEAWGKQRQFIADASHELKTPLTIILANNNIALGHPEKTMAEQQQWLESTEEEANRMNGLVTDLLMLAQVEDDTGGSEGTVDLSALVERSLLQFDAVFFERGINSEAEIEEGLHARGNQEHLRRLIDILLDNASKYGNAGGSVTVHLAHHAHKPHSALLTVGNTGAFIPPEKIDRVFERFYRVDEAHSTAVEGSGLGLALAQEIVREHGGSISVTSVLLDAAVPLEGSAPQDGSAPTNDATPLDNSSSMDGAVLLDDSTPLNVSVPERSPDEEQLAQTTFSVVLPLM